MSSDEYTPDFAFVLADGAVRLEGSTRFTITRETCPELVLPTGRLAASGFGSGDPFVETVPPGRYRAAIFTRNLAELDDNGTVKYDFDSVAAVQITVLDSPVATWEPAMVADDDPELHNKYNTFAVDGGVGVICDDALGEKFIAMRDFFEPFEPTKASSVLAGVVDKTTGANALCVMYGGDGVHDSWIGRTADGAIACFVIV